MSEQGFVVMSYLDELKKQAEAVKAKELSEQEALASRRRRFTKEVMPAMMRTHKYLFQMAEHLNYIKPAIRVSYTIKGAGKIDNLLQGDYLVSHFDEKNHAFFLRFSALSEKPLRFDIEGKAAADMEHNYLWQHNIHFDEHQVNDANGHFLKMRYIIRDGIIVEFNFKGDYQNSCIQLQVRNFDKLGKRSYHIRPEQIDQRFLDDLAQYITRSPEAGDLLIESEVSNDWAVLREKTKREAEKNKKIKKQTNETTVEKVDKEEQQRQEKLKEMHKQKLEEELKKAHKAKAEKEKTQSLFGGLFRNKK